MVLMVPLVLLVLMVPLVLMVLLVPLVLLVLVVLMVTLVLLERLWMVSGESGALCEAVPIELYCLHCNC